MACDGTAHRLWQTWDGGDGETWLEVPCQWPNGNYLCWPHKMGNIREGGGTLHVPEHFKADLTQREIAKDIHESAKAEGRELQRQSRS